MPVSTGPTPVLPSSGAGQRTTDGDILDPVMKSQGPPGDLSGGGATLTALQVLTGLIVADSTGGDTYTLPTVALFEAAIPNARLNDAFDFAIVSLNGTGTLAVGTGWTLVGHATIATVSGMWRCRKTGDGAWTAYRLA